MIINEVKKVLQEKCKQHKVTIEVVYDNFWILEKSTEMKLFFNDKYISIHGESFIIRIDIKDLILSISSINNSTFMHLNDTMLTL